MALCQKSFSPLSSTLHGQYYTVTPGRVVLQPFLMHSLTQNCNFATYMAFLLQQWGEERLEKGCASLPPTWCHFSLSPAKVFSGRGNVVWWYQLLGEIQTVMTLY